jgi:hypothetical protein
MFSEGPGRFLIQAEEDFRGAQKMVDGAGKPARMLSHAVWVNAAKIAAAGINDCPKELDEESLRHVTAKIVTLTIGKQDARESIPLGGR